LSRQLKKPCLDSLKKPCLDSLKNLVLTAEKANSGQSRYPNVLIFNKVSIKTLDLDTSKTLSQHFQKPCVDLSRKSQQLKKLILDSLDTLKIQISTRSRSRLSILTVQNPCLNIAWKPRHFQKPCVDVSRILDLDLDRSQLLRHPSLLLHLFSSPSSAKFGFETILNAKYFG
jgi:hypothetical protein